MALTKIGSIGINTGIAFAGVTTIATLNGSDNVLSVGGTVNFVSDVSIGGTVSIAGTLTYEDVTNIDAVGLITARNGVVVGSGITLSSDGDIFATGVTTSTTFSGNFSGGTVSGTTGTFTGDVDIADKIVHTGDTDTAIRFSGADTITAETGGSERLRIDSNGRLAISLSTARASGGVSGMLQVERADGNGAINIVQNQNNAAGSPSLVLAKSRGTSVSSNTIVANNDTLGNIKFAGADGTDLNTPAAQITGQVDGTPGSNDMPGRLLFYTTADGSSSLTERLRITSSGQVFIGEGVTSSYDMVLLRNTDGNVVSQIVNTNTGSSVQSILQLQVGTDRYVNFNCNYTNQYMQLQGVNITKSYHDFDEQNFRANNGTERFKIDSSGNVTVKTTDVTFGGSGILRINSGSTSGALNLDGGSSNHGGEINLFGGSNGGRILFRTGQGSGQQSEKMRLDENGKLGLGNASPSWQYDQEIANSGGDSKQKVARWVQGAQNGLELNMYGGTVDLVQLAVTNAEQNLSLVSENSSSLSASTTKGIYIQSGGDVFIGATANSVVGSGARFQVRYSKTYEFGQLIRPDDNDTGGGQPMIFQNAAGASIGSIGGNASNASFNTSSDYRLKENVISLSDGITRVKQLSPKRFNWIVDETNTLQDGFLAHEVQTVVPESVTGTKDETNDDGSVKPQQLDHSKLVPVLTAAIQELIAEVETLKTEVAALKG